MARTERTILRILLPPAFWLGVWQFAAFIVERRVGRGAGALLLPGPVSVLRTLLRLGVTLPFWKTVALSLGRILLGMLSGVTAGALLAALTAAFPWADRVVSPAIRVVRATPVTSFILLLLLWTGRDTVPVFIAALMVLPVVWDNIFRGIQAVDKRLIELSKAYRFSPLQTLRLIYLPSLKPYLAAALGSAMGLAWKSGTAAEVLCLPRHAIGTRIYQSKLYLEIPELFAWTVVVVSLSLILEHLLRRALRGGKGASA